jgi:hypothetical protein
MAIFSSAKESPMTIVRRLLNRRIGPGPIDSVLTKWGLCGGGLVVFGVVAKGLPGVARNRAEIVLGVEAALVLLLVMVLLGVLGSRFHDAASRGDIKTRSGAYLSYPAGLVILILGGWQTSLLGVGAVGIIIGFLLLSAACMAILCLGVFADLARSSRL